MKGRFALRFLYLKKSHEFLQIISRQASLIIGHNFYIKLYSGIHIVYVSSQLPVESFRCLTACKLKDSVSASFRYNLKIIREIAEIFPARDASYRFRIGYVIPQFVASKYVRLFL